MVEKDDEMKIGENRNFAGLLINFLVIAISSMAHNISDNNSGREGFSSLCSPWYCNSFSYRSIRAKELIIKFKKLHFTLPKRHLET